MSGYILCQTKKAEHPYFIENISTNIYTIEELCYYLYHNLYLIDNTIINEELCTWLADELELPKLAAKLRPHLGGYASAADILYPVFKEINYLSYEELRTLNGKLAKLDREAPALREKRKGDALVGNAMYVNAIRVYQKLLDRKELEQTEEGLTEKVYHNLGCAYSYLFQMDKAMECFWNAYMQKKAQKELKCYLLVFKNVRTSSEYNGKLRELSVNREMQTELDAELEAFRKLPETQIKQELVDGMLEKFTRDYHRSTGS